MAFMTSMNTMGMYTDEYLPRLIDAPDRIRCGRLWLIEFDHRCNQNLHKVRFTDLRLSNSIIRHGEKVASSSHESNRRQSYNCIDGTTQGQGPQTSVDSQERTRKDDVGRFFVCFGSYFPSACYICGQTRTTSFENATTSLCVVLFQSSSPTTNGVPDSTIPSARNYPPYAGPTNF